MSSDNARDDALDIVRHRSHQLDAIRALAEQAIATAAEDRLKAIRAALAVAPSREVAEAAGISVQRLYQITKENK